MKDCGCYTCTLMTAAVKLSVELEKLLFNRPEMSNVIQIVNPQQIASVTEANMELRKLIPNIEEWK